MKRVLTGLGATVLGLSLLAGCASGPGDRPLPGTAKPAAYPRTVEVPGDPPRRVTLPARPARIAALSPDVAEAVAELAGTERLVAVPASAANPSLSGHAERMAAVPAQLPPGTAPDPERIISLDPDLILVTTRHGGERDAEAMLARAGIPMIAISNGWSTLEEVRENLTLLGRALGAEARAAEITAELDRRAAAVAERVATATDRPTVAILSNQAGRPFLNAADVLTSDLVRRAGGALVADRIGLRVTGPVTAERLIAAEPDAILLIDVTGRGHDSFRPLLGNPAVAGLPAVREGRVRLLPARVSYGVAGPRLADGLDEIARWLHPEAYR